MSEFKGTKGEWIIYKTDDEFAIVKQDKSQAICFMPSLYEKSEANAKLIVCAPEMLGMLKDVLAWVKNENYAISSHEIEAFISKATE